MKKNVFQIVVSAMLLTLSSCADELLDNTGVSGESQPTEQITSAQLAEGTSENPDIPAAVVSGLYAQMVDVGSGGTTGHDDFGHKSYDVFSDMMSGDMALSVSTYGWYRASITELQAMTDFTFGDNRQVWRYYYRIIRSANSVIETLGGNEVVPENDEARFSMGQAKAMRAHSYFYLSQFFQREYNEVESILPLYLEAGQENLEKSTAGEIYAQMEQDLNDAISLLNGFVQVEKNQVDQNVARMILAYVLGAKGGRDADVASLTQAVINSSSNSMLSAAEVITNGFSNVNTSSWMWGIDITENLEIGLISWWGQVDSYSYSYAWAGDYKAIDENLYNAIADEDARKAQFLADASSGRYLQPLQKFFASDVIGGTSQTVSADYVYMRIEEAYLLNAEANSKIGNDAAARMSLKALMDLRVPDASYVDALNGIALADEIYLQTRIELWGEGKSFLALKRNKGTIVRGANHLSLVGESIPYNDERLQFEIPLDEIQNNPFINNQND